MEQVELANRSASRLTLEVAGLTGHGIKDALAAFQILHLGGDFLRRALLEHFAEHLGRFFLARNHHPSTGPRQTPGAGVLTPRVSHGKRVCVPMRSAKNWSNEIVLRNPPLDGCGGQEADVGRVPAVNVRVRDAAEDRQARWRSRSFRNGEALE